MTTVANQSVGSDSISGSVKGGVKSNIGNHACFLGAGQAPGAFNQVSAGAPGGALGPGSGLPQASAGTLTSIEAKHKGV